MIAGTLALAAAAMFTGAAVWVTLAEQPARLALEPGPALQQWVKSYARGRALQGSLALLSAILGAVAYRNTNDGRWLIGAALIGVNWPYTYLVMMPLNNKLEQTAPADADGQTRENLALWGRLHAVRALLGLSAALLFAWVMN